MSLPMARARRWKVPSIQRSPNSRTCFHSRTESSKPSVGDVAGLLELGDLPVVLDQPQLADDALEVLVEGVVGGHHPVHLGRDPAQHPGLRTPLVAVRESWSRSMWRHSMPSDADSSWSEGRRPTHSSPYCRSRKNSSVSRADRGPRVEDGLAALDHQHRVAGLVAGEVGVRRVGAELVVGVVGPHLERAGRQHQPLTGERRGQLLRAGGRRGRPPAGGAARARGRPSRSA